MNLNAGLALLGFVSIFHIVGGIGVGVGLRHLRHGFGCNYVFFFLWGAIFGIAPLGIGVNEFERMGISFLIVPEILIIIGAICIAAFVPGWILEAFRSQDIYLLLFGGVFLVVGLGGGLAALREQFLAGVFTIFLFGGVGALIFGLGLRRLFKDK